MAKKKYKTSAAKRRKARKFYRANIERYREYSRLAQARRRSEQGSMRLKGPKFTCKREAECMTFTYSDLMKSHDNQSVKMFNQILRGERMLVT